MKHGGVQRKFLCRLSAKMLTETEAGVTRSGDSVLMASNLSGKIRVIALRTLLHDSSSPFTPATADTATERTQGPSGRGWAIQGRLILQTLNSTGSL